MKQRITTSVRGDIQYAFRLFRRSPSFTTAAVLTLALCLGANLVIFAIVYGTILRPSPYPDADRLVWVWSSGQVALSHDQFTQLQPVVADAIALTAFTGRNFALLGGASSLEINGVGVSPNHFGVFGEAPALGRAFVPADGFPGAAPVAVISHELWTTQFGADPTILNRTVDLYTATAIPMAPGAFTGNRHTVIGVMTPDYRPFGFRADVVTPLVRNPGDPSFGNLSNLYVTGRIASNTTVAGAQASIISAVNTVPAFVRDREAIATDHVVSLRVALEGQLRPAMLAILAGVGLILLMGCVNVANLFLVRAHNRDRELTVRYALGATRGRIIRQFLVESFVLSIVAAGIGVGLAIWSLPVVVNLLPVGIPTAGIAMDAVAILFGTGLVCITAVICGVMPAVRHAAPGAATILRSRLGSGGSRKAHALNRGLLVGQISLAVILVHSALMLFTDFSRLVSTPVGFSADQIVTARVAPATSAYRDPAVRRSLYGAMLDEVRSLPDVVSAGAIHFLPIAEGGPSVRFLPDPQDAESVRSVGYRVVTPGYFETMDIPVMQGRSIQPADIDGSSAVGLINQALASQLWPGADPIGRTLYRVSGDVWFTVVGVAGDVRQAGLGLPPRPEAYVPLDQSTWASAMTIVARVTGSPALVGEAIRGVVVRTDPDLPVTRIASMPALIAASVASPRFFSALFGTFAALAILLGAVGVYGVITFVIQLKRDEIGVRIALGATRATILRQEMREGALMTGVGIGIGLIGSGLTANAVSRLLTGAATTEPLGFVLAAGGVAMVAGISILLPVARASRLDPMQAIRAE